MIRVLIAEDDPIARQLLENYANQSGRYVLESAVESAALAEFCCRTRRVEPAVRARDCGLVINNTLSESCCIYA